MLLLVDVLYGVLYRDDSAGALFADSVDERGDGSGFASSCDSCQEYEALLSVYDVLPDVVGEADLFYGRDVQ